MAKFFFVIMLLMLFLSVWASFTGFGLSTPRRHARSVRNGSVHGGRTHIFVGGK